MRMMSHRFATRGSQPMTDTTPNTGLQFRTDVEEDYGPVTDWATDFDLMDPDYVVHPEQRWTEQRNGGCPIAFTQRRQRTWLRSGTRRVGKEGVSTCRSRGSPEH